MHFNPIPFVPKNPLLQKHISYFYFLRTDDKAFETRYYAFPHTHVVLNIHNNTASHIDGLYTHLYGEAPRPPMVLVQGIREMPLLAHLKGKLDKVTILFKPLGINHFTTTPFGDTYPASSHVFTDWEDNPGYQQFLIDFYATDDTDVRAALLENVLLALYRRDPVFDKLDTALQMLGDFDLEPSVENICNQLQLNVRTFNRIFRKHLGISPIGYRKVARFRHSLQNKLVETNLKRMTDLAYQSNYYDQAYFNKIYRNLTGSNPQRFFKGVDRLADDRLIFQFMNK